ncbi:MAG: desulfoferrodoxin [Candidatus Buchananbacteria bacterium]
MEINQIYKCESCGNIVELVHVGGGGLVCCGQPMQLQKVNTVDASQEKHVPVVEKTATGIKVKVGSVAHPMEESHYIEWIEVIAGDEVLRKYLRPGDAPEAEFALPAEALAKEEYIVREYCNLHGLWKA